MIIREVMTQQPVTLPPTATIEEAAKAMREDAIGPVILADGDRLEGIVTDRDIVVRAIAEGMDPRSTTLSEICTSDTRSVEVDQPTDVAVRTMREFGIRRLPVVEREMLVGVVSIGDLAISNDEHSALADISDSAPNN